MKKVLSLVLALAMAALCIGAAVADTETTKITIRDANPGQTYTFYRVFDASISDAGVSYKVIPNHTLPENDYFVADGQGNISATAAAKSGDDLTAGAIAWLKENAATVGVLEKTASLAEGADAKADLEVTGLTPGYYFISTTTGTVVSAHTSSGTTVTDKNPPTTIDKTITGGTAADIDDEGKNALAQVGSTVDYNAAVPIANGAINYVFTDKMTSGLTLNTSSIKVYLGTTEVTSSYGTLDTDATNDYTFKISFDNAWLAEHNGETINVKYSATVNADAIETLASNPNTARIRWGNEDDFLTDEDDANVKTAKITVIKTDGDGKALDGAGFILKKKDSAEYYTFVDGAVVWATSEEAAQIKYPVKASDAEDALAMADFPGLQNGEYTLIEKVVPPGYNKAADQNVTIKDVDANDLVLEVEATVVNNSGTELPSTGGIGTTIFYILGGLLVIGAAVILVARRKAQD